MPILSIARTVMSSLFKKPATTKFPFQPIIYHEGVRGHIENEIDKCVFCGVCQKKCPTDAITVKRAEGYWSLERRNCITCNSCTDACPKKCLIMQSAPMEPEVAGKTLIEMKGTPPPPVKKAE